jgi:hypothetical protein
MKGNQFGRVGVWLGNVEVTTMDSQQTISCAVATGSGFAMPYKSSGDDKGYMEKHPEMELVRTSLLSKLMSFASSASRRN